MATLIYLSQIYSYYIRGDMSPLIFGFPLFIGGQGVCPPRNTKILKSRGFSSSQQTTLPPPRQRHWRHHFPANTNHLYNICTTSDQRLRRWLNMVQMLHKCFVFTGFQSSVMHNTPSIIYSIIRLASAISVRFMNIPDKVLFHKDLFPVILSCYIFSRAMQAKSKCLFPTRKAYILFD